MDNWSQNPLLGNKPAKKTPVVKPHNLIEAIKETGGTVKAQTKAATLGTIGSAVNQLTSIDNRQTEQMSQPQMPFNFSEYLQSRENQIRQQERNLAYQQRSTETLIFHQKEEAAKKEIEIIKAEIKKLVLETGDMTTELAEAEKSVMTTTVAAGVYHKNFFDRIRHLIALARKQICESKNWLQMFNSRSNNRNFYWGQVKKSGTKYMLSHERYMATQAG
ncbi:hypothetical protein A2160_06175 [Candidatus Beckwithbacteria bacterium RBG_13_42_9]|uniref:DUF5660 domain-containing protein n=1 Tax=Candidatus Beckwithbacteria bacterium RBG_13_42_9 TaxID=1797457 RepID=A0A1F5E5B3_9BACT|nr:MAG: hypothetical protein A2160_06175 [Candidatus Beckwithbacteria bacterium RBG_13_42_9]